MKDRELKKRVLEELEFEPRVDATFIGVSAKNGIVSIYGHVGSFLQKMAAEEAAQRVRGVRAIANELDVNLPGDAVVQDDEIARRAAHLLDWDEFLGGEDIAVSVRNGRISLAGETGALFLRERAGLLLARLPGVTGVSNHVRVVPAPEAGDIAGQIRAAFDRLAVPGAGDIRIEVQDGEVTLRGEVGSFPEKTRMEEAASHAPGVRHVASHLTVRE